jgi:membrane protein
MEAPEASEDFTATTGNESKTERRPRRKLTQILKSVIVRAVKHDCTEVAGEMAFDFSFSIFPAALFAATLAGLLDVTPMAVSNSLEVIGVFLHDQVRTMVESNVSALVESSSQPLLTLGFLGAVWAASSAINATIKALNRAYNITEFRSFWYRRLLSVGLMFGVGLGLVVSFNLLIMGTWIETQLLVRLGLEDYVPYMVSLLKMPAGFLGVISMSAVIYRIAPNCRPRLTAVLPGAISFSILWFGLSQAFGTYVSNFSYYNRVTGTLGVMIIFQLWIYLTALLLLLGGELNAELDRDLAKKP